MTVHLIGYAFGLAGVDVRSAEGPLYLKAQLGEQYQWDDMIKFSSEADLRDDEKVRTVSLALANQIAVLVKNKQRFCVIGGDHSSAIGTWSGAQDALYSQGELGLIWIDAHMDSHTPETTESGRIHGMPLACLLGYGYPTLTGVLNDHPKLKPANVCLIGVRSFERGEEALLKKLNVHVYFMDEVKERGLMTVLNEAIDRMKTTAGYGISLDLDSLDPECAPGVNVSEPFGLQANELLEALMDVTKDIKLIGMEIAEFNPYRDKDQKTEKLIVKLLDVLR